MIPVEDVEKHESDDSGPFLADVKDHERDAQEDEEKPGSPAAELRGGESSSSSAEAKGDHSDGEHEEKTEIPGLPPNTSSPEPPSTRSANEENDAEENPMSSRDISTMRTAIESGDPKAVKDLVERLSDTLAVDELTTTYGGGYWYEEADKDGLFQDTFPILHAAQSGNLAVFESVIKAMQTKLSPEKVKSIISYRDSSDGSSLFSAVESGSVEMFKAVMVVVVDNLPEEEVKSIISSRNELHDSLLSRVVESGSVEKFKAVMVVVVDNFPEEEVKSIISHRDKFHGSLLSSAVESGSVEMFKAVMVVVVDNFPEEEVKSIISSQDELGGSLLSRAVKIERVEMFEVVMSAFVHNLLEEKVKEMILHEGYDGKSFLTRLIDTGSVEMFKVFMATVAEAFTPAEIKELISGVGDGDFELFSTTIGTENVERFKVVITTIISDKLIEEEAAMKHERPNTPGHHALEKLVFTNNEDQIYPKGITKLLPGPHVQPDAGGDSTQSGENKLKTIDILTRGVLSFLPTLSLCQCLRLNQAHCNSVRAYLSDVVVDAESGQPWTGV